MLARHLLRYALCFAAASPVWVGEAVGQQAKPPASGAPLPARAAPVANLGAVEFAEEPLKLDNVGLQLFIPAGTIGEVDTAGNQINARISPRDAAWAIKVATPTAALDVTVEQVADAALVTLLEAVGIRDGSPDVIRTQGRLLSREPEAGAPPLLISGHPAVRWYARVPALEGKNDLVRGFTVLQTMPGQFITFELLTTDVDLPRTRPMFQTVVAAATIEDPAKIQTSRAAAIAAGRRLIEGANSQTYSEIIAASGERWERLYRPASSGSDSDATELGYRRIRLAAGNRADMDRSTGSRSGGDRQEGYIVRMDARIVGGGLVVDSQSVFFMSSDREHEAWTVRNGVKNKDSRQLFTEAGARTGTSMIVKVEGTGTTPQTHRPSIQGEGYVSQVEALILPQLLLRSEVMAEHGYYAYQSQATTIRLRRDLLEELPGNQGWRITTRLTEDRPAQVSYFRTNGELIRTELPDGSVWEPTTLQKLEQLWRTKGLPMD
jgi:hypothetical protein